VNAGICATACQELNYGFVCMSPMTLVYAFLCSWGIFRA